ncbi:DUF2496 domain-containing protein [Enterobacter hormaechei]|uniref:DUF2496 domain-containing protein n=1 Tax=Enterobacter hormaechei TaxID=158836 RepID=UPI0009B2AB91|nr:DUF2496 domain-containing protein [Enterobacter hormaechei]
MSLENAPDEVKLAVDLIMLLENHEIPAETVLKALDDAPRDKCAHFREINGTTAAFQYLQKNYNPTASSFL